MKQLAASHSLKATFEGHIRTPFELYDYDWAKNKIVVIRFLYVEKETVDLKSGQDIRFQGVTTRSGTTSYHVLVPKGGGTLLMGNISQDINTDICSGLEYIWLNLFLTLYCQILVNTS